MLSSPLILLLLLGFGLNNTFGFKDFSWTWELPSIFLWLIKIMVFNEQNNGPLESNWLGKGKENTPKWPIEWLSSQCLSILRGWGRFYYKSVCNLMCSYELLREEKQCPGVSPLPGGQVAFTPHTLPSSCLAGRLLCCFSTWQVDAASQGRKGVRRVIMAAKELRILSHTSVWWIKDRPFILGHAIYVKV